MLVFSLPLEHVDGDGGIPLGRGDGAESRKHPGRNREYHIFRVILGGGGGQSEG